MFSCALKLSKRCSSYHSDIVDVHKNKTELYNKTKNLGEIKWT